MGNWGITNVCRSDNQLIVSHFFKNLWFSVPSSVFVLWSSLLVCIDMARPFHIFLIYNQFILHVILCWAVILFICKLVFNCLSSHRVLLFQMSKKLLGAGLELFACSCWNVCRDVPESVRSLSGVCLSVCRQVLNSSAC